ncbi:hypothetical protein [uncultured Dysosmobacter sp.]|uniref:hypothetical protein n=1 Tax=uncultured Dysosmobacter sp. TaxID=2591384 RepID=UPI0026353DBE|nr:hypothetical protein [uncultured Dysosmobacter sp.]
MTIDELKARKKVLQARKKQELDLQAAGRGDNLALFMVEEELLDVNAQLRALTPGRRVGGKGPRQYGEWAPDKQQYVDWLHEDQSLDDKIADGRAALKDVLADSRELMTEREWEVFDLWSRTGMTLEEMSHRLGVDRSVVSRTLQRAKAALQREAQRQSDNRLHLSSVRLDMRDPAVSKIIMACMTETQAVYVYLYYGEWMTLREISALTGTNHSSILRAIYRALSNIGRYTGYRKVIFDNMDAMGEIAYRLYVARGPLEDPPDPPTPERRDWGRAKLKMTRIRRDSPSPCAEGLPPISIQRSSGERTCVSQGVAKQANKHGPHGPLLEALLRRRRQYLDAGRQNGFPVFYWLRQIFRQLTMKNPKGGKWPWKK